MTLLTKTIIAIATLVLSVFNLTEVSRVILTILLFLLLAYSHQRISYLFPYIIVYGIIVGVLVLNQIVPFGMFVVSFAILFHLYLYFFCILAVFLVLSSPVGEISEGLSKIKCPKSMILAILVSIRFFSTYRYQMKLVFQAIKNRRILTIHALKSNILLLFDVLLVPIMYGMIRSAEQLSASAITRAAEAPYIRSSYAKTSWSYRDSFILFGYFLIVMILLKGNRVY